MDKPRLLIVEDEKATQTQLRWALSEEYEIAVAEDRNSALESFTIFRPYVVTLDLGLPPVGYSSEGLRLLKEILDLDPLTRVVVITGNDDQSNAVKAVDMGAFDFYLKPVDIGELKVILRRALHLRKIEETTPGFSPVRSKGSERCPAAKAACRRSRRCCRGSRLGLRCS